jgi:hypothetical protein
MTRIIESDGTLFRLWYGQVCNALNDRINMNRTRLTNSAKLIVREVLLRSPDVQALSTPTELTAILGFDKGSEAMRLDEVMNAIANGIVVRHEMFRVFGARITGHLEVCLVPQNYKDLLNLSSSIIQTEKGEQLNWVRWMLTAGDRILISDHTVVVRMSRDNMGRSGHAVMILSPNARVARIPPPYAGTEDDNFITRTFTDEYHRQMEQIIYETLQ